MRIAIQSILAVSIGLYVSPCVSANDSWEESRRNGEIARDQGRYPEARRYLETALIQAHFDAGDLRRADLNDELAGVCQILRDYEVAERLYADALNVLDQHPDDGSAVRAIVLGGLGLFRARQGRIGEAADLFERALASGRLAFGEKDVRLAAVQTGLGQVYVMKGRLADAESLLQSALEVERGGPPSSASDRVVSESSLGVLYTTEGRYSEAEAVLRQATEEARLLGESYPGYAGALASLADLYRLEGESARAEPLLKKAQAIYEAAFGPESPRAGEVLLDRSVDSLAAHKSALAEAEIGRALDILRGAIGPEHPTVAMGEVRMAQAYTQQGKYAEAGRLLLHALAILEKTWPEGHFLVADCLYELAEVERLQHHYLDAELQYQRAIAVYEKAGSGGSRGLALALRQYAKLLRTSRAEEARALEKRAQGLQQSLQAFR